MKIDTAIVEQARNTDMVSFLNKYSGYTFKRRGGSYRCEQHPSLAVKDDRLSWYWHSRGIGGHGVYDYLVKAENMRFRDAVEIVTGIAPATAPLLRESVPDKPKILRLPEKKGVPIQIYTYLCNRRGIDDWLVHTLIRKGNLYEDRRGNVVFVGFDEHGKARFASVRGTCGDFRGDCAGSDKRYAFYLDSPYSGQVYVFESPIDALSRASMEIVFRNNKDAWKNKNYLSLAGTSDIALPFFLDKRPNIKEVVFCLDRDEPGQEAAKAMSGKYADKGYYVRIEHPFGKDFNEDLMAMKKAMRLERPQRDKAQGDICV